MPDNWELGSNYSMGIGGFEGLQQLADNLNRFVRELDGPIMREALWAGAEEIRSAMEAATPVDTGQAKAHVIIYERAAKTYSKGQFSTSMTQQGFVEGVGTTNLLVGWEKQHAYYIYFVEHGYTPHRAGDIVVRTRAGGKSVTKHFRPEDLYFGAAPASRHKRGWTKAGFGREAARREATGGGRKVQAHPIKFNVEAAMKRAEQAAAKVLEARIGMAG